VHPLKIQAIDETSCPSSDGPVRVEVQVEDEAWCLHPVPGVQLGLAGTWANEGVPGLSACSVLCFPREQTVER
jgi:hypothetical protein